MISIEINETYRNIEELSEGLCLIAQLVITGYTSAPYVGSTLWKIEGEEEPGEELLDETDKEEL